MKAKEISGKSAKVLTQRIQIVSAILRILIFVWLIFAVYWWLAFFFGWPAPYHDKLRVVTSQHHIYTSPAEMSSTVLALVMIKIGLGGFCALVLNSLFQLYQHSIIFSSKNVRYIRFLGYYLMMDWLVDFQLQSIARDMHLSCTPLFIGLLLIFIAWIMDKGREIQEEQELTV